MDAPAPAPEPDEAYLAFAPVPLLRVRARGWTPQAQVAFIAMLAQIGHVGRAAASVGLTARSAYHLRDRPGADGFARAWDRALEVGVDRVRAIAMQDCGLVARPLYRNGREVGSRMMVDRRLTMAVLRSVGPGSLAAREMLTYRSRLSAMDLPQLLAEGDALLGDPHASTHKIAELSNKITRRSRSLRSLGS